MTVLMSQDEYDTVIQVINDLPIDNDKKIALIDNFDCMVGRIYDDITKDVDLGAFFRRRRLDLGMSQHQAAYYLRMDEKTMAKYEANAMPMTFKALVKLCRGFGIKDDKFHELAHVLKLREDAKSKEERTNE